MARVFTAVPRKNTADDEKFRSENKIGEPSPGVPKNLARLTWTGAAIIGPSWPCPHAGLQAGASRARSAIS
jgi:hypothetical protein